MKALAKIRKLFRRRPAVVTHDLAEMPCDMGRKIYRRCRVHGCDFSETVPAPAADRLAMAPTAMALRTFQDRVRGDVEREIQARRNELVREMRKRS